MEIHNYKVTLKNNYEQQLWVCNDGKNVHTKFQLTLYSTSFVSNDYLSKLHPVCRPSYCLVCTSMHIEKNKFKIICEISMLYKIFCRVCWGQRLVKEASNQQKLYII